MNKDVLSQQEIDALLHNGNSNDGDVEPGQMQLSPFELDALGEIGNICFGTAATALSTLLRHKVEITTPTVEVIHKSDFKQNIPVPFVAVKVDYSDGIHGSNVLAIQLTDAAVIADLMLGGDGSGQSSEFDEMHLSAVAEAMNQMMGSASTSMSTLFNIMVNITPPLVNVIEMNHLIGSEYFPDSDWLAQISFRLIVGTMIDSYLMQMVPLQFAKEMVGKLIGYTVPNPVEADVPLVAAPVQTQAKPAPLAAASPVNAHIPASISETPLPAFAAQTAPQVQFAAAAAAAPLYAADQMTQGYGYSQAVGMQSYAAAGYAPNTGMPRQFDRPPAAHDVRPVQFTSFETTGVMGGGNIANLDLLLDIPLSITVELGRAKKQIREILELVPGSIVELDKLAGEPVDIMVNNKLVAKGEVVVIEENFGVRVTDIISTAERIRKLQ
ncbi:MAG: flagellar motor switch phosphatase FliY [Bacilli bacterium]|nr:flagellar motor switch phosphatase FliY [Bacilli bacterium]